MMKASDGVTDVAGDYYKSIHIPLPKALYHYNVG